MRRSELVARLVQVADEADRHEQSARAAYLIAREHRRACLRLREQESEVLGQLSAAARKADRG